MIEETDGLVEILRTSDTIKDFKRAAFALSQSENEGDHDELYRMALGENKEGTTKAYNKEEMVIGFEALAETGTEKAHNFITHLLRGETKVTGCKHLIKMSASKREEYRKFYFEDCGNYDVVSEHVYPNAPEKLRRYLDWRFITKEVGEGHEHIEDPEQSKESKRLDAALYRIGITHTLRHEDIPTKTFSEIHKEVRESIESRKTFEETIKRINQLNILILESFAVRSRYPISRNYFENTSQKDLESKGINTIGWNPQFSPILEKICEEGEVKGEYAMDRLTRAEARLERFVYERIVIGENAAKYKAPRGMPTTRKQREDQIIHDMRSLAGGYGLEPAAVEKIFRFLIDKNKDVQERYKECNPIDGDGVVPVKTSKTTYVRHTDKSNKTR